MFINTFKVLLGHIIIVCIFYPWRLAEKITGCDLGGATKSHYYIMKVFRIFFNSYPVVISYPNRLAKEPGLALKLKVDLCQNNQQWFFRLRGSYEEEWIRLVLAGMEDAGLFVDIGSNIGVYANTIAQACPDKEVIAVEPLKENYETLKYNIALNSLSNIKSINSVVSGREGKRVKFFPNPIHDGGGSIIESSTYRTGDVIIDAREYKSKDKKFISEVEVDNVMIDDLIDTRSVIKIDVEGAEVSVIKSGSSVLKKGLVDMMVVEVLDDTIDKVISLADELGFDSFMKGHNNPIAVGRRLDHFVGNIVCLRRESPEYDLYRGKLLLQ